MILLLFRVEIKTLLIAANILHFEKKISMYGLSHVVCFIVHCDTSPEGSISGFILSCRHQWKPFYRTKCAKEAK